MPLANCWSIFLALLVRVLYAAHCVLTIWRLYDYDKEKDDIKEDGRYWILFGLVSLLVVETIYVVVRRNGKEWKW